MRDIEPKIVKRYSCDMPVEKSGSVRKTEKRWPNVSFDLNTLPEAKDWEIGKEYFVTLRVKMTGLSVRKSSRDTDSDYDYGNNSTYDITGVEVKNNGKTKKSNEKENDEDDD